MTHVDYGSHGRVGVIYMHSSIVLEPEFHAMLPADVSLHVTRIVLPTVTVGGLDELARSPELEQSARLLAAAPLDVIAFGGTSASFLHGLGWDRAMIERMAGVTHGIPVTTTSTASLEALRAVGAKRIAVAAPYNEEVTSRAKRFFEENDLDVLGTRCLGLEEDHAIGAVTSDEVRELGRRADDPDADALFISCTNLRTAEVIADLEQELGKPVVSAIQATVWSCLASIPGHREVSGFGSLFGRDPAQVGGAP